MIPLTRELVKKAHTERRGLTFNLSSSPLQNGLAGDPFRVAVASMLLCRCRRAQMLHPLWHLLTDFPSPEELCRADESRLQSMLRPTGFQVNRARQLVRFANQWFGDFWTDMRELPGVGLYVADAVGLFCFSCTKLESTDGVLKEYVDGLVCAT